MDDRNLNLGLIVFYESHISCSRKRNRSDFGVSPRGSCFGEVTEDHRRKTVVELELDRGRVLVGGVCDPRAIVYEGRDAEGKFETLKRNLSTARLHAIFPGKDEPSIYARFPGDPEEHWQAYPLFMRVEKML